MSQDVGRGSSSWRQQAVTVNVHRACPHCGAPGVWTSEPSIKEGWPGVYVEPTDERNWRDDKGVGERCPNCGLSRASSLVEKLGEVWRKIWV